VDLSLAILLFLSETGWLVLDWIYGYGLEVWAAQGEQAWIDAAGLAHIGRLRTLLIVVLVLAVLAAVFRAPWTVTAHLLVALLVGGALSAAQQDWDRSHTPPVGCVRHSANC
jgi:xanthine/uracil permease